MVIDSFEWDEDNINHIARHRVTPDEAEEIFIGPYALFKTRGGRYLALGRTIMGRYLICVFEKFSGPTRARVITARDMEDREKRLYKQRVS